MKKGIIFFAVVFLMLFCLGGNLSAQQNDYSEVFHKSFDSGADDHATRVAIDSDDNIIVVGRIIENDTHRGYMIKYDKNGNELWNVTYTDNVNNYGFSAVRVDLENNIVAAGYSNDGNAPDLSKYDALLAKYDSNGNLLWDIITEYVPDDWSHFKGVAIDSNNNIVAAGAYNPPPWTQYYQDYFFKKYDQNGNQLLAIHRSTSGYERLYDVEVDSDDDIFLVGRSQTYGINITKFDVNGNFLYSSTYYTGHYGRAHAGVIDSQNNIYATGYYENGGIHYYRTVKFDATTGTKLWHKDYAVNGSVANGIAVNSEDNIVVTGGSNQNILTILYDPNGNILWEAPYDGGNSEGAGGVVVDSKDNIIVTGISNNGVDYDFLTIKYGPTPTAVLELTHPNGGEVLTKGEDYTITWNSTDVSGDILIHLYKGGTDSAYFVETLAASDPNDGAYPFNPPDDLADGSDYYIGISAEAGTVWDFSNNPFTIETAYVNQPPTAPVLSSPANGAADIDPNNIILSWIPSTDPEGDVIEYCVTVNEDAEPDDIPVYTGCDYNMFQSETTAKISDIIGPLEGGKKYWWAIWAKDSNGSWSEVSAWRAFSTSKSLIKPKLWGLFIGINNESYNYEPFWTKLNFFEYATEALFDTGKDDENREGMARRNGAKEAEFARNFFIKMTDATEDTTVLLSGDGIIDHDIEGALENIRAQMQPGDKFVFYICGHGLHTAGNEPEPYTDDDEYLVLADPNNTNYFGFGFSDEVKDILENQYLLYDDELENMLQEQMGNFEKWIFVDSCFSGGFFTDDIEHLNNLIFVSASIEEEVSWFLTIDNDLKQSMDDIFNQSYPEFVSFFNIDDTISPLAISLFDTLNYFQENKIPINKLNFLKNIEKEYNSWGEEYEGTYVSISDAIGGTILTNTMTELFIRSSADFLGSLPIEDDDDKDGFTENQGDCNDADNTIYPGAIEITFDGIDQNCNGIEDDDPIVPEISLTVSPDILWPPNHKMKPVTVTADASDNCDANPDIVLVSVISNEPDDAPGGGDGHTTNDIQDADIGTEDYNISLRAERSGGGDGRIYTITYTATDASGNSAQASATVTVPHDKGKKK